ncbi:hypothetical protein SDC9_98163 [bioreactor metagenome]|uniref:Uncharacterized protein n=1 Tax=bioreactor metagenome TaxID=1076179 RepID=A0A645ADY3_9ZZZZ
MPREHKEIRANVLHIHRRMRNRLRAVHQRDNAALFGDLHHLLHRHHRAQRVGHMADGDDLGAVVDELLVFVQADLPLVVHRNHAQLCALGLGQLLPRHDIGVVLQVRDDDLVALAHVLATPALGHQIDGLGGAAHKDHLVHIGRVDEAPHHLARMLVCIGRAGSQGMRRAVDVGVFMLVEMRDALNHLARLVRGGGVVQPDQLLAVDALRQNRKIAPHRVHVKPRVARLANLRCRLRTMRMGLGWRDESAGQRDRIHKVKAWFGAGVCNGMRSTCRHGRHR